ncbi:hypothetical protein DFH94DRAFT_157700 [Russula ochroleuca]|jgi:hypothetical protein|uniref:Uncharacterized protein n=1 Tax=Russula ochroleuca TaxID=152965 RepID=A0A9P5TCW5_9AGAM|nr:hypothetical protein DFH94DRAFT_157700 [Russula ochroleuca]
MMAPLLAGTAVLLDLVEGLVDQVGTVLPAAAVLLVGMAVTEAISNERAQEGLMTGTQSGHDIRFFAIRPRRGCVSGWYDSHFPFSLSLLAFSVYRAS